MLATMEDVDDSDQKEYIKKWRSPPRWSTCPPSQWSPNSFRQIRRPCQPQQQQQPLQHTHLHIHIYKNNNNNKIFINFLMYSFWSPSSTSSTSSIYVKYYIDQLLDVLDLDLIVNVHHGVQCPCKKKPFFFMTDAHRLWFYVAVQQKKIAF